MPLLDLHAARALAEEAHIAARALTNHQQWPFGNRLFALAATVRALCDEVERLRADLADRPDPPAMCRDGHETIRFGEDADSEEWGQCPLCTTRAELAAVREERDRLFQDRYDLLGVKTTDGLSASEWMMRTAAAERERNDLRATSQLAAEEMRERAETCRAALIAIMLPLEAFWADLPSRAYLSPDIRQALGMAIEQARAALRPTLPPESAP